MASPRIAFVTTCKNRTQHLRETLPANLADNQHARFVVLNYGSEDDLVEYLGTEHHDVIQEGRLVLYSHLDTPKFRMSHAKNMAHRLGILEGADILVNLDADNYAKSGFDGYIQRQFARHGNNIFLSARMKKGVMPRGINGRIAVTKNAFIGAGGYDEIKFEGGWSSEDKHFVLRLRNLGYQDVEIAPFYLDAIRHNDRMRFAQYPEIAAIAGKLDIRAATITQNVVNNGSVGCGRVFRNFDFETPITVEPLGDQKRTRVFGIGWHKTATTSLHHALEILGYRSWHWTWLDDLRPAHAGLAIWREMKQGRSAVLERCDALGDFPIPLLYRKLDEAYPGSKFILTVRNDRDWLHAAMRHFSACFNPNRANWHLDPFTNPVHQIAYGRQDFEPDIFLSRYRRHNADVLAYFQNRPDDLLIMDMDRDAGWPELCGFLGLPIPSCPYPYLNGLNGPHAEV